MVARITLGIMHQDREEPMRSFGARLPGQANVYKFNLHCQGEVDYTKDTPRNTLIGGINDNDIQLDLLGLKNLNPLVEVLLFVEAKECRTRSVSHLQDFSTTAANSSYRREKRASLQVQTKAQCGYCQKYGHGHL